MDTDENSRQTSSGRQASDDRCQVDRQRRHAREEWFNQWSHIWTARQTPEWRPRRASVATCQQQHQQLLQIQSYHHYHHHQHHDKPLYQLTDWHHCGLSERSHFAASQSISELKQNQDRPSKEQQLARETSSTYRANIEVNKRDEGNKIKRKGIEIGCGETSRPQGEGNPGTRGDCEPIVALTKAATAATDVVVSQTDNHLQLARDKTCPSSSDLGSTVPSESSTSNRFTASDWSRREGHSCCCCCCCDRKRRGSNSVRRASLASQVQSCESSTIGVTEESGGQVTAAASKANRPASDLHFCPNKQTTIKDSLATCCPDYSSTEHAVPAGNDKQKSLKNADSSSLSGPACVVGGISEKIQLQHKQRKHLILSMALKQMIAERDMTLNGGNNSVATGHDSCNCGLKDCSYCLVRSKSRVGVAASGLGAASVSSQGHFSSKSKSELAYESRKLLSNSRTILIDKLQTEQLAVALDSNKSLIAGLQRKSCDPFEARSSRCQKKLSEPSIKKQSIKQTKSTKQQTIPTRRSASAIETSDKQTVVMRQSNINQGINDDERPESATDPDWPDQDSPLDSCELDSDDNANELNIQGKGPHGIWSNLSYGHSDKSQRSQSVQSKTSEISEDLDVPTICDLNLETLIVESWLDDHQDFAHDYFMRKATPQLVDNWLIAHAKISNTNLSSQLEANRLSRPSSQLSLNMPARGPTWRIPDSVLSNSIPPVGGDTKSAGVSGSAFAFGRPARSNSQSSNFNRDISTPVRKISATDFESRTGSGFLRPMLSTTPDGRLTFVSQPMPLMVSDHVPPAIKQHETNLSRKNSSSGVVSGSNVSRKECTMEPIDQRACDEETLNNDSDVEEDSTRVVDEHEAHVATGCGGGNDDDDDDDDESSPSNGEVKLIFELVKNICNDLDIRTLLHKILRNIAVLINADKSSLFLVCGEPDDPNRHLVSQLFNVDQDSSEASELNDSITIPWGTGLVGYVAESGEAVNIANCYEDPRFTNAIDQRTGYVTKHMLCAPIFDNRNEIVGVAQVINKRDGNPFSKSDEVKFKRYLQFCGIGLRNAQSYENCQLENRRNQVLLDLARMVFEEQSTIEQVVYRIMLHTQSLLECQRCQVLLIDDGSDDLDQLLRIPNSIGGLTNSPLQRSDGGVSIQPDDQSAGEKVLPTVWRPQFHYASRDDDRDDGVGAHDGDDDDVMGAENKVLGDSLELKNQHVQQSATRIEPSSSHRQPSPKLFSLVFDLECDGNDPVMHSRREDDDNMNQKISTPSNSSANLLNQKKNRRFPINIGITGYVAMTGETLNIEDAHKHERFDPSVDEGSDFKHKSILCMPIKNGQRQIIGVSQLINKKNGRPFNKNDEDLFEAFAIFCGLGIHNTLMYERVLKIMAKQKVTFEVLSYHATAPLEEAKKLSLEQIPSCFALNLASLKFNDFSLDDQYMLKSCLRFFMDLDLMRRFQIDQLVFCNWILSVQKNYRKVTYHPIVGGNGLKASPVRYHNWRHAFNVSQMMFAILVNTQICQALGELETLGLLIACLCHDLDHRGTNNSFQIKSASPLAELYSTSTMEHHHFDQCVMILNSQGNQILANLSPTEYSRVIMLLEEAILATDLANYFQKRDLFFKLVNSDTFDWQHNPDHRSLLRCMLMTACDVAAITKPWPVQKVVADLVMSEFYQQGDIEKNELNMEPIDMMNRDKMSELPEMQISFIDTICAPIYTAFAKLFPHELTPLLDGCLTNRALWTEMANSMSRPDEPPLFSYLNNNDDPAESSDELPDSNNISKSEMNIHCKRLLDDNEHQNDDDQKRKQPDEDALSSSLKSSPFEINHKPVDGRPSSACECLMAKSDPQRRSI